MKILWLAQKSTRYVVINISPWHFCENNSGKLFYPSRSAEQLLAYCIFNNAVMKNISNVNEIAITILLLCLTVKFYYVMHLPPTLTLSYRESLENA